MNTLISYKRYLRALAVAIFAMTFALNAFALEPFVVKQVQVHGLQRIQVGTVMNYLPISIGQTLSRKNSSKVIASLYRTGFFKNVWLARRGNTLIINVRERATIGAVDVKGVKDIPKEKMQSVLKNLGLVAGHVFDRSVLEKVQAELKSQYNNRGKYNAQIKTKVTDMARNRVNVQIIVSEGRVAKIKEIKIIGNHAFSDKVLIKQMVLSTSGWFTWFTSKDEYAKEKLDASVKALQSYYLDNGYLHIKIVSTQVSLTPDHKHVYITIKVDEGKLYHFSGFKLAGKLILPREQLRSMVHIKNGDVFSRSVVNEAISDIGTAIGNIGYGFPSINAEPIVDEKKRQIFINIYIDPGVRVYVHRIRFVGNTKTADYVLRHNMVQNEASLLRISDIKESERKLRNLGYFKDVSVKTKAVPGTNNQVDLEYHVKETPSTTATASVGWGTLGPEFNAGINEPNFLGTGRTVGINLSTRRDLKNYSFNYFNPFISSGVGRGYNIYYTKYTPGDNTPVADYTSTRWGGDVTYNVAISDNNTWQFGGGYENHQLRSLSRSTAQYTAFTNRYGSNFNQLHLTTGWSFSSYDQIIFPTSGYRQQLSATLTFPADGSSLTYYKVSFKNHFYLPITHGFILSATGSFGYGNGLGSLVVLPFYENYYAGGVGGQGQVRGYETSSLGPKDSRGDPIGGNLLVSGSVAMILPYPLSRDSLRTSLFVDGGNVYAVYGSGVPAAFKGTNSGPFRFAAGIGFEWRSPFGPLQFGVAFPLNKQPGDRIQYPSFNIAAGF